MKILFPLFVLTLASLTTSCKTVSQQAGALSKFSPLPKSSGEELKEGMTKEEIRSCLGKPSYQYAAPDKETWVYQNGNMAVDKVKETAMNMVPVIGPTTTLLKGLKTPTHQVKAVVAFDCDGKVTEFYQKECGSKDEESSKPSASDLLL